MSVPILCLLWCLVFPGQSRAVNDSVPVVVLPLEVPQAPPEVAQNLTGCLQTALAASGRFRIVQRVVSPEQYAAYLYRFTDLYEKQQARGTKAPGDSILFEGVAKLIWGKVTQVGTLHVITLNLVDIPTSKVERIVSYKHKGDRAALPDAIRLAAADLIRGLNSQNKKDR